MKRFLLLTTAITCLASPAFAQKAILTGGDKGAYFNTFCPPLPQALGNAMFAGYRCQPSGGTLENIKGVLEKPSNIGFVQLDVFAREAAAKPDLTAKLTIIRQDLACEGLWMVTKNPKLQSFGDILGYARRTTFVIGGETSGSAASFKYLQSIDPDGLGRAGNDRYPVKYVSDTTTMLNTIAAGDNTAVGFFVQFADPENANIKRMMDAGLTVIPVVSREIAGAKVGEKELYQIQSFSLTAGGFISSGTDKVTACTPVAIITGNPESQSDKNVKDDQKDLIAAIRQVPSEALLPQDTRLAKLMRGVKRVGAGALTEMLAAADKAKKAAESMAN